MIQLMIGTEIQMKECCDDNESFPKIGSLRAPPASTSSQQTGIEVCLGHSIELIFIASGMV